MTSNKDVVLLGDVVLIGTYYNSMLGASSGSWKKYGDLPKVWRSTKISLKLKLRLFDSLILPVLLYGAESCTASSLVWCRVLYSQFSCMVQSPVQPILLYGAEFCTATQKLKNKLNAFGTSCYRILLNISRIDRVTNQHVLNVTQKEQISKILLSKQLRVLGHSLRRPNETTIMKYALYTKNQGRNRRGRPCATYMKLMEKVTGMDNHALTKLCKNRKEWRRFVVWRIDIQTPD